MGEKFAVLRTGQPITKLQVVVFKDGNYWAMIVWWYHYSLGGSVSLLAFQCDGIRIWNFEHSSNMRFCLVRGSNSGSFFSGWEIYWHSRGSTNDRFFLSRDSYWQVRWSSSLSSESFGGGISLVDGQIGRLFSFIIPLIIFRLRLLLPFWFLLPILLHHWIPGTLFGGPFCTTYCHGICWWCIVSTACGMGRRRSRVSIWNDDQTNCDNKQLSGTSLYFSLWDTGNGGRWSRCW